MFRKFLQYAGTLLLLAIAQSASTPARAGTLAPPTAHSFGTFGDIDYVLYKGRFTGVTALGDFNVPYEIVAPANPGFGNGIVFLEPPHFLIPRLGRDLVFGDILFGSGYSYATIGFGNFNFNILDPTQSGLRLAGDDLSLTSDEAEAIMDVEIIVQFIHALAHDPIAVSILGPVKYRYAFGFSQTARLLLQILHQPSGQGLFDLTIPTLARWRPIDGAPLELWDMFPDDFEPIAGVGKVIFMQSEGDQVVGGGKAFRPATADPTHYRIYEVSGTPHNPLVTDPALNSLNYIPVARAALIAGDAWVRNGVTPPPSLLMTDAAQGEIDPIYGFETGIARDLDGNALGGVRLPEFEAGRGLYIASLINNGLPLIGGFVDLSCEPVAGSDSYTPRFPNHGSYVRQVSQQAALLVRQGYVLEGDAEALVDEASNSMIGKPGSCATLY